MLEFLSEVNDYDDNASHNHPDIDNLAIFKNTDGRDEQEPHSSLLALGEQEIPEVVIDTHNFTSNELERADRSMFNSVSDTDVPADEVYSNELYQQYADVNLNDQQSLSHDQQVFSNQYIDTEVEAGAGPPVHQDYDAVTSPVELHNQPGVYEVTERVDLYQHQQQPTRREQIVFDEDAPRHPDYSNDNALYTFGEDDTANFNTPVETNVIEPRNRIINPFEPAININDENNNIMNPNHRNHDVYSFERFQREPEGRRRISRLNLLRFRQRMRQQRARPQTENDDDVDNFDAIQRIEDSRQNFERFSSNSRNQLYNSFDTNINDLPSYGRRQYYPNMRRYDNVDDGTGNTNTFVDQRRRPVRVENIPNMLEQPDSRREDTRAGRRQDEMRDEDDDDGSTPWWWKYTAAQRRSQPVTLAPDSKSLEQVTRGSRRGQRIESQRSRDNEVQPDSHESRRNQRPIVPEVRRSQRGQGSTGTAATVVTGKAIGATKLIRETSDDSYLAEGVLQKVEEERGDEEQTIFAEKQQQSATGKQTMTKTVSNATRTKIKKYIHYIMFE